MLLTFQRKTGAEIDSVLGTSMCACGKCSACEYKSYKKQEYFRTHNTTVVPKELT